MNNQNYLTVKLSKNGETLLVDINGQRGLISVNLVKHLLEIPYTKKDGTAVSIEQIKEKKEKAQKAYVQAILNKTAAIA